MAKLPSKDLSDTPAEEDLSHIVDVSDLTANPLGTSKRLTIEILRRAILRPAEFTAFAGGGQGSATILTAYSNDVTVVATPADSVKMVVALVGETKKITNSTANAMDLFPDGTEEIDAGGAGIAISIGPGVSLILTCYVDGFWKS